ncbi:Uncharacterized protein HZ326_2103 [Fusarium oxysporum f. sp. albedinis]|nr:Uncharacterized protein HZ326_2103 [Fusarium oxysporum f. sp. albedinis]
MIESTRQHNLQARLSIFWGVTTSSLEGRSPWDRTFEPQYCQPIVQSPGRSRVMRSETPIQKPLIRLLFFPFLFNAGVKLY